jgi:protein-S-isoprenylcysteine O-methyltransferase Ste14
MQRTTSARLRRWELGIPAHRWGDLALFGLLLLMAVANASNAYDDARSGEWLASLYRTVVAISIGINAVLFLLRGPAVARGEGWIPKVIAIVGGWAVTPLTMLPLTWQPGWLLAGATIAITVMYLIVIWALLTLRSSFSVFPEARQLVRTGPYRLIRHPLYASYIVTDVAILLPRLSPLAILVTALAILAQLWRARFEERILSETFPDYAEYAATTPRFVPAALMPWRTRRSG